MASDQLDYLGLKARQGIAMVLPLMIVCGQGDCPLHSTSKERDSTPC